MVNGLHVLLVSDPSPVPHDGLTTSSCETAGDSCPESESSEESEGSSSSEEGGGSDVESEEGGCKRNSFYF